MKVEVNGNSYRSKKRMLIEESKKILSSYTQPITLRQLYYRLVARECIENKKSQYSYLSQVLVKARLKGEIAWDDIEDRLRSVEGGDYDSYTSQEHLDYYLERLKEAPDTYHRPRWEGQSYYIEVWVEKEALSRLFEQVCDPLCVRTFAGKGYASWTSLHEAYERFIVAHQHGRDCKILYFGDFDPSGKDIERFITEALNERLGIFIQGDFIQVQRIALTRDQIVEKQLPPQPAKETDTRYEDFVKEHGDMVVELDAIEPDELQDMIREAVNEHFDFGFYESEVQSKENREKQELKKRLSEIL